MAEVPHYTIPSSELNLEHQRLHEAIERSCQELQALEHRALAELGQAQSRIFSAHLTLLRDEQFAARIKQRVSRDFVNVERALEAEVADLARLLASVENEYLRERAQDIRDVGQRVMRQLAQGTAGHYFQLTPQSVIIARELLPSETIDLDREHVVGIVTEEGGENSHAAILARALGIPAVTGIAEATTRIAAGTPVLVDGSGGRVTILPSDGEVQDFLLLQQRYTQAGERATAAEKQDCVTLDGVRVSLLANLNRPHEAPLVASHYLDGVGLFRTEFLFMDSPEPPSFDCQLHVLQELAPVLGNRPLVVRTLDLGGDKIPSFLQLHHETNPMLGLRGLRFSLSERSMFLTQLRSIIAASEHQDLRILFPMVLGDHDLREAVDAVRDIAAQLGLQPPAIGAMIETPAALFALDHILPQVSFVSIGTNDLTQFLLAADRRATELSEDYSALHPSVLRAVAHVVDACKEHQRDLCVCGEAAGDPQLAGLLVGLGIRQLSMSPLRAAQVRYSLQRTRSSDLTDMANQALRAGSPRAVRQLLNVPSGDCVSKVSGREM